MKTMTALLAADAARIKEGVGALMARSGIHREREYDNIVVLNVDGNHWWNDLDIEGRRIQDRLMGDYRQYRDLVQVLIRGLPADGLSEFKQADDAVTKHVQQQRATWAESVQEAKTKTLEAIDAIQALLERLFSVEGETIIVPDTNALLLAPALDQWTFEWCDRFTLVFTPTVLSELDELKVAHKNPDVRAKAERMIRQIKELGRRGDLLAGVPVVTGKVVARSVAVDPKVSESLPWLDAANNDDRLLASVVELIRRNVRAIVVIVTGDINLQNKASHARIPAVEPPDIAQPSIVETVPQPGRAHAG
jgi:rRNA-processing protein FCF1